jgi:uncharacterized oxidoreductase
MKTLTLPYGGSHWPCTLVTGASSGIGRALSLRLADHGVRVIALGRQQRALDELAATNALITPVCADLSQIAELQALSRQLIRTHPDLGCIIHNAGIQCNLRFDDEASTTHSIQHEVDTNLVAPLVLTRALLAHLQSQPQAWIVNVTSGLGYVPKSTSAVYCATKAALHLFTQGLQVQLRGTDVHAVEAVMPLVDTPMTAGRGSGKLSADEAARQIIAGLQSGRNTLWIGKAKAVPWLMRIAPGVLRRVMARA